MTPDCLTAEALDLSAELKNYRATSLFHEFIERRTQLHDALETATAALPPGPAHDAAEVALAADRAAGQQPAPLYHPLFEFFHFTAEDDAEERQGPDPMDNPLVELFAAFFARQGEVESRKTRSARSTH
jgi:hypothetical protein